MLFVIVHFEAFAQVVVPLYPDQTPNSIQGPNEEYERNGVLFKVSKPSLIVYPAAINSSNGTAVIICPGGGYGELNIDTEGYAIAAKLNKLGMTALVLKYRLPDDKIMPDKAIAPLQDVQQAIKFVRQKGGQWNIDKNKIGVMGFSAGGHLAATAGTHFDKNYIDNPDSISLRPDFMILVYPVISLADSLTDKGTRIRLIGENPPPQLVDFYCNELQVNSHTPPAFLIHAEDDAIVTVKNSLEFFKSMHQHKVSCGLHIFSKGGHGFPSEPASSAWFDYCANWLLENGWAKSIKK
ncbi:MAG: alpha/beta hydrolase [Pedobacter sp.]|nr:MAG: alpha/beta hydrolase [Pedobacter sp.]